MQECSSTPGKPTLKQFSKRKKNKDKSWKFECNRQYNSGPHLDDPDLDIVYYVLENRGALGPQNKQKKYNTLIGGTFAIQPNISCRPFFANKVNLLRPLTSFVEELLCGCLIGL